MNKEISVNPLCNPWESECKTRCNMVFLICITLLLMTEEQDMTLLGETR